jgi:hypothetical protein
LAHGLNRNNADQNENSATATKGGDRPDLLRKGENCTNGNQPNPKYHKAEPCRDSGHLRKLSANLGPKRGQKAAPDHFK